MKLVLALLATAASLAAAPAITSAGPCPMDVSSSDQMISVAGSGFVTGSVVNWAGAPLATNLLSPTLLSATIPARLLGVSGKFAVTVGNPDGSVSNSYGCAVVPLLDRVDPAMVAVGQSSAAITANGRGFRASSAIAIDFPAGRMVLPTSVVSATQLTGTIPGSALTATGLFKIYIYDTADSFASQPMGIYVEGPQISNLSPASVTAGGPGFTLYVFGAWFNAGSVVRWNGSALPTVYSPAVGLSATVPANLIATPGTASITVASGSIVSTAVTLTIAPGAVPSILNLAPSSTTAGGAGFTLTVTGSDFVSGAVVRWNGAALATTFVSSTSLTATVPGSLIGTPGGATVSVANPGGGVSGAKNFTITALKPTISSVSPASVAAGTPGATLTITGTNFVAGQTTVRWNGAFTGLSVASSTQLTVSLTADKLAAPGTFPIVVSVFGTDSAAWNYTVTPARPVLNSLLPSSATAGGPAYTMTVFGNYFLPESVVQWNGSALTTTYISATELKAAVTTALIATAGAASITVSNPGGLTSDAATLRINGERATLVSLTPLSAVAGGPSVTLEALGSGFLPASKVQWNGSPLATTYISPTSLTASVPASLIATAGTVQISIANPGAANSPSINFQIAPAPVPVLTGLNPIPTAGGPAATVTITGSNFVNGAVVQWNGAALATTFVSATELRASVPAEMIANPGSVTVTVSQTGGSSLPMTVSILSPNPAITRIDPASVIAGGPSFTLRVSGTGFGSWSVVQFNGQALTTTPVSPTELTGMVRAELIAAPGAAAVTVRNADSVSSAATLDITAPTPTISTLTPPSAVSGGPAFTLSVTGTGFLSGAAVEWNGAALATTFVSATGLQAQVPAASIAAAGTASIDVLNPGGKRSAAVSFPITPASRALTLSPSSATAGGPGFTLTVTGVNFAAGSTVQWSGTALATTFVDATQLRAAAPASLIATPGTASVTVAGGAYDPATFTILPATPRITSITPSSVTAGSAPFTMTVSGADFATNSIVRWNGAALTTTFVDSGRLTATVPAGLIANTGSASITVATGTVASSAVTFTIGAPAPVVSGLTPATAAAGSAGITLTVFGSYFTVNSVVQWNGAPLQTAFVNATQLAATVPAQLLAEAGGANVVVVTGSLTSSSVAFTITAARPVVSSLAPSSATAGGAAFTLTVSGSGFSSGCAVNWDRTRLVTTYVSATRLTANVPASLIAAASSAAVTVVDVSGAASLAVGFTVNPALPAITQVTPESVTAGGPDFQLTVNGSGFLAASVVQWNGSPLATTFVRDTQLTAAVPKALVANAGEAQITVSNAAGFVSTAARLTVAAASFSIVSLSPSAATAGSAAFTLTINGSGFVQGAAARWNSAPLQSTFIDSGKLLAQVSASLVAAAGDVSITVANPSGATAGPAPFRINSAVASISSLDPDRMTAGAPVFRLVVNGTGFLPGSLALWNGEALPTTYVSPTRLMAEVAANLVANPGAASITAISATGQPPSAAVTFPITPLAVASIDPASAPAGSAAISIAVSGSGFLSGAIVYWDGQPLATTFTSATRLVANAPAQLLAGEGGARISVSNPGGALAAGPSFTITTASRPTVSVLAIRNSASGGALIAPGALISIYGANLANGVAYGSGDRLPIELGGASVSINGIAAPLLYTSPGQINAQAPFEIQPGTANVVVTNGSVASDPKAFEVKPRAPGLFTSTGNHALAFNAADWSVNSTANPAAPGQYLILYLTGQGVVDGAVTGGPSPQTPATLPSETVQATIGGKPAKVAFVGLAPGFVGLCQINLIVPAAAAGEQSLEIVMDGVAAEPTVVHVGGN